MAWTICGVTVRITFVPTDSTKTSTPRRIDSSITYTAYRTMTHSYRLVSSRRTSGCINSVNFQLATRLDGKGGYPPNGSDEEYSFYIEKCFPVSDNRRQ